MLFLLLFAIPVLFFSVKYFREKRKNKPAMHFAVDDTHDDAEQTEAHEIFDGPDALAHMENDFAAEHGDELFDDDGSERVLVYSIGDLVKAHLVRGKLESEGIETQMLDDNVVGINPLWSQAVGGIKIKVRPEDVKHSEKIIHELDHGPVIKNDGTVLTCPVCHSPELYSDFKVYRGIKGMISVVFAFLFSALPLHYTRAYKCKSCGATFEKEEK